MRDSGEHIVIRLKKRWQVLLCAQAALYALGMALVVLAISESALIAFCCFTVFSAVLFLFKKPWQITLNKISNFLDEKLGSMENSTSLLLVPKAELSNLALLQRYKVEERLKSQIDQVPPKVSLKKSFLLLLVFAISAFLLYYLNVFGKTHTTNATIADKEVIVFQAVDSTEVINTTPSIERQKLNIRYPAYTNLSPKTSSNMNIKALEGSQIFWSIDFDRPVDSVFMDRDTQSYPLKRNSGTYLHSTKLTQAGFYNFKFKALDGAYYVSDLYAIELVKDAVPEIEVQQLKQFSTFDLNDDKKLKFSVLITDDYGISDAYIIATVTKGEGESVKFREERLAFERDLNAGSKKLSLTKTIDLEALKMEAGDELYFYIEALDVKQPNSNRTRSETFFAVIRDTVSNTFGVEGTMGADLMPDYFRSQRQLIIDTEKLIASKNQLSVKEFNFTSNALGYDQKALRLKYGEFMGDEADSGIQVTEEVEVEEPSEEEQEEEDPLKKYTHDHDGDTEHNAVDHDHDEEEPAEGDEGPLSTYLHNHDDPEAATLFSQSLKSKLRQAMAEMWDAELHLRLYTPENSLPYQFRALKLIQEIKNSARIYVHRIGFDPPPIKEDKRLTGEIDAVKTSEKVDVISNEDAFEAMRKAVTRIAEIYANGSAITDNDRTLFKAAGNELAVLAIEKPGSHLNTLQSLKWLSEKKQSSWRQLLEVQSGLLNALPELAINPNRRILFENEINTLMLKELEIND
ncbi:MAG: tryptophan-rich sensory protein [Maribacter sp.]|uniref:tryptophan-rich sensory protein n=1 Tax=Maribacter sp. TaxID=1897614 RepID=UPI0032980FBD